MVCRFLPQVRKYRNQIAIAHLNSLSVHIHRGIRIFSSLCRSQVLQKGWEMDSGEWFFHWNVSAWAVPRVWLSTLTGNHKLCHTAPCRMLSELMTHCLFAFLHYAKNPRPRSLGALLFLPQENPFITSTYSRCNFTADFWRPRCGPIFTDKELRVQGTWRCRGWVGTSWHWILEAVLLMPQAQLSLDLLQQLRIARNILRQVAGQPPTQNTLSDLRAAISWRQSHLKWP